MNDFLQELLNDPEIAEALRRQGPPQNGFLFPTTDADPTAMQQMQQMQPAAPDRPPAPPAGDMVANAPTMPAAPINPQTAAVLRGLPAPPSQAPMTPETLAALRTTPGSMDVLPGPAAAPSGPPSPVTGPAADIIASGNIRPPMPPQSATMEAPDGSNLMYTPAGARPPNYQPQVQPQPGFGARLKAALPRMLTAGIAAAATPSHYGGGALDIFQGMQAGDKELERRDAVAYDRNRQTQLDTLNQRKTEAEIGETTKRGAYYDSEAEWRKAQAKKQDAVTPSTDLYLKYIQETDPKKKEQLRNDWLLSIGHPDKQPFPYKRIGNGQAIDAQGNIVTDDPMEKAKAEAAARDEMVRMSHGTEPALWPLVRAKEMSPAEREFIGTGKTQASAGGGNPTAASLAYAAANGDPIAASALKYLEKHPQTDPALEAMRNFQLEEGRSRAFDTVENTKNSALAHADNFYETSMNRLRVANGGSVSDAVLLTKPEGQHIASAYQKMQQDAYNAWTQSIRTHGGTAPYKVVNPDGSVQDKPQPVFPLARLEAFAKANNITPQRAREILEKQLGQVIQ